MYTLVTNLLDNAQNNKKIVNVNISSCNQFLRALNIAFPIRASKENLKYIVPE